MVRDGRRGGTRVGKHALEPRTRVGRVGERGVSRRVGAALRFGEALGQTRRALGRLVRGRLGVSTTRLERALGLAAARALRLCMPRAAAAVARTRGGRRLGKLGETKRVRVASRRTDRSKSEQAAEREIKVEREKRERHRERA